MLKNQKLMSILFYCLLIVSVLALVVACEDDVVKLNDAELTIDLSQLYPSPASPEGATVVLKKASGTLVGTKEAESATVVFGGIDYGTYMLEITHPPHPICINEDIGVYANHVTHFAHFEANVTIDVTALFPDNIYNGVRVNYEDKNIQWSGSVGVDDTGIVVAKKVRYGTYHIEVEQLADVDGVLWDETIYSNNNMVVNQHTVTYTCSPQFAEVTIDLSQLIGSPADASVTLRRSSGGTTETKTATGNNVVFENVAYGLYHIEVTHSSLQTDYLHERLAVKESQVTHTCRP